MLIATTCMPPSRVTLGRRNLSTYTLTMGCISTRDSDIQKVTVHCKGDWLQHTSYTTRRCILVKSPARYSAMILLEGWYRRRTSGVHVVLPNSSISAESTTPVDSTTCTKSEVENIIYHEIYTVGFNRHVSYWNVFSPVLQKPIRWHSFCGPCDPF